MANTLTCYLGSMLVYFFKVCHAIETPSCVPSNPASFAGLAQGHSPIPMIMVSSQLLTFQNVAKKAGRLCEEMFGGRNLVSKPQENVGYPRLKVYDFKYDYFWICTPKLKHYESTPPSSKILIRGTATAWTSPSTSIRWCFGVVDGFRFEINHRHQRISKV